MHYHDQSVFDLDRIEGLDAATNHAGCYIVTDEVDDWHARLVAAGVAVTPIADMPWGMHEFTLTDPAATTSGSAETSRPRISPRRRWPSVATKPNLRNARCSCCGDCTVAPNLPRLDPHKDALGAA